MTATAGSAADATRGPARIRVFRLGGGAIVLWQLLALLPSTAAADTPRFIVPTYVDPCVPIDRRRFQELLAVELGATPDYGKLRRANDSAAVSLTCVDGQVQLELDDAVTRKSMRRRIDLLRVDPEARTRLMALTTAEFVLASWLEIQLDKQRDALEPSGPPPPQAARDRAARALAPRLQSSQPAARRLAPGDSSRAQPGSSRRAATRTSSERAAQVPGPARNVERAHEAAETGDARAERTTSGDVHESAAIGYESDQERESDVAADTNPERAESATDSSAARARAAALQLGAAVELLSFTSVFQLIPAGALRLTIPLNPAFALRASAQIGHAQLDGTLVTVGSSQAVHVRATIASLLLAALYTTRLVGLEMALGLGGRVGLAYLAGARPGAAAVTAKQAWGPWAGPALIASLSYPAFRHLGITLALELGVAALGTHAVAPNNVVTELGDVWLAGSLGLDWAF